MSKARTIARRGFLKGIGGALALPLLPSLARAAETRTGDEKPTFVAVFTPNGQQRSNFWPLDEQFDWSVLDEQQQVRAASLAGHAGSELSRVLGASFAPVLPKMLLVRGLDFIPADVHGHYSTAMLSGWSRFGEYHETIDQVMARSSSVYPAPQQIRSLHQLVPSPQPPEDPMSVSVVGGVPALVRGIRDARRVFELLFEDQGPTATADASKRERRRWVMDRVLEDYRTLEQSSRISAVDRARLDAHATHIHELQRHLERPPADLGWCTPAGKPELLLHDEVDLPQIMADHIQVLVAALRCGITRVATLQLADSTDVRTMPFLDSGPFHGGHHQITHELDGAFDEELGHINRWYGAQVASLLQQLDDVIDDPETGRTLLDKCVVYWGNEFGSNPVHQANAMPVVLAGGACGKLETGRYLDYRRHGLRFDVGPDEADTLYADDGGLFDWRGRPYNELLVTILDLMGVPPEEYSDPSAGLVGFGDYSNNRHGKFDLSGRGKPLPYLVG